MKKSTILDFFKVENYVSCPACSISMPKSKLNEHLDTSCCSSSSKVSSTMHTVSCADSLKSVSSGKSKFQRTVFKNKLSNRSRLSLKKQKQTQNTKGSSKKNLDMIKEKSCQIYNEDDDVVILDELVVSQPTGSNIAIVNSVSHGSSSCMQISEEQTHILKEENNILNESGSEIDKCGNVKYDNGLISDDVHSLLINNNGNVESADAEKNAPVDDPGFQELNSFNSADVAFCDTPSHHDKSYSITDINQPKSGVKSLFPSESKRKSTEMDFPLVASDVVAVIHDAEESLDVDDNVFSENSSQKESKNDGVTYSPYYIANFKHILKTVLAEEDNKILFNDEDLNFVRVFESSSDAAQKLYVRLFQRKYKWLRINKINYPDITKDPFSSLEELVKFGLIDAGAEKIDLLTALDLLSLPEAKSIIKHFNLNSGKNKTEITEILLKHCKEHKSVFFTSGSNISNKVLKKAKQIIGHCYRLSLLPKRLFTRILMLFSLPTMSEDDEEAAGGQQQQLLTLLQVNKGELVFPECKGVRKTKIFETRDDLIRYEEAKQLENDILKAVENKKFELAKDLFIDAKEVFDEQCTSSFADRDSVKPVFLKRYTSLHVYIRCLTQGVEILQKLRQYNEAVELLKKLLSQKIFCQDYRGRWWDRMALNLEQHLKKPQEALEAIKEALKDTNVRVGYRYSLLTRALRITKSADEDDEFKKQFLKEASVIEAPKVVMRGRLFPRNILGRRNVFISSASTAEDDHDITVLGVEQLALEHYKNEGFTKGIHGEGSTFISLYALLFWDIIYDGNIPDAFISPYQTHPLDLNSESFFCSRENQILNHLKTIENATVEELKEIVKCTWEAHFNKASLVAWDRFTDLEHVQGLVSCFGNKILSGICERLARDFRFTRSGVPDLVVWNPETLCVKIVEVKGPGDKLSSKQILWLDYLIKLGAEAEVCLIEAVGSKKLRKE